VLKVVKSELNLIYANLSKLVSGVLVSLTQLVWTMHNKCKVQGLNPDHHKKKISIEKYILKKTTLRNI